MLTSNTGTSMFENGNIEKWGTKQFPNTCLVPLLPYTKPEFILASQVQLQILKSGFSDCYYDAEIDVNSGKFKSQFFAILKHEWRI